MWPDNIKDWLEAAFYFVGIVAALVSGWQYLQNSSRERTKWLHELYRALYGDQELQDVLWRVDPENTSDEQLKELMEKDGQFGRTLDRFLNFFQFVAVLVLERKELEMKEVMTMFKFPLKLILKRNGVIEYVRRPEYEFRELCALLARDELQNVGQ